MPNKSIETDAKCPNCGCSLTEIEIIPLDSTTAKGQLKFVCFWENCSLGKKEREKLSLWRYI
jgi:hypothetical protein